MTNRDPVWLTPVIKDMQNRRDKVFRSGHTDSFNLLTRNLNIAIERAKTNLFKKEKANVSKWWRILNSERGKNSESSINNIICSFDSPQTACRSINSHFLSLFHQVHDVDQSPLLFDTSALDLFDECEIISMLGTIKLRSSPGPDGLPPWLFKHFGTCFAKPLCHLINSCLISGTFPMEMKRAIVVPIPKVPSPKSLCDLRPISLTSILSKLLERAILKRTNHFFVPNQVAYRPNASTTCALVHMTHSWLKALDASPGSILRVIAIDYAKAFDSVDHSLLIAKLHSYNLPFWAIAIFRSFLTDRKQCVRVNGITSEFLEVKRGIPQGSVCGPLLFSLFINDLRPTNPDCTIHKYADDQTLTCPASPASLAQDELSKVVSWCKENCMALNLKKTNEMLVSLKPRDDIPSLSVGGEVIDRVEKLHILGLTISNNLRWQEQLHSIERKCRSDMFFIWRLRCMNMPIQDINKLINALILPKMTYGYPAWCNLNKTEHNKLCRLYRRICNAGDASAFLPLESLLDKSLLALFSSAKKPRHSLNELIPCALNTRYNMRSIRLPLPKCRLSAYKDHFVSKGVSLYNRSIS